MRSETRPAILVTGASSGIGRDLALTAPGEVVLVARSQAALEALAGEIRNTGRQAHVLACDLSERGAAERIGDFIAGQGLHCDILVNNAGFGLIGRADSLPHDGQINMIDLNVRALSDLTLAFLPGMLARGRGGVMNVASVAGFLPGPNMAMYYATKAFVRSFSFALWQECHGRGVTVTALCPGPVATGFFSRATGGPEKSGTGKKLPRLFRFLPPTTSRQVAEAGWKAFAARRRLEVPGLSNWLVAHFVRFVPTGLLLQLVASAQKRRAPGMTP